jgi:hypothetical protein
MWNVSRGSHTFAQAMREVTMNRKLLTFAAALLVLILTAALRAQPGPPFFGGGSGFDPEPGVVMSGAGLDAQATVSADRRYVTITTGANLSRLQDLRLFAVQQTNFGFVGGGGGGGGTLAPGAAPNSTSPTAIANQNSLLNREGMFLLVPLQ